jgi:3-hydroxybutyryl-CoA dehydrogenase
MAGTLPLSAKIAVVGAGTMGSGIAHVAARAGHEVLLLDSFPGACERGKKLVEKDLDFLVGRGKLSREDADATAARIRPVHKMLAMADAALVIEAIAEDMEAKRTLYHGLETEVSPQCVIASNTSSLSITALAQGMNHPGRLVGMHFFNPAPRMALVEIVSGLATDPTVAAVATETARAWGKTPVQATSTPGFIVNRVARPFYGEAMRFLTEQAGSPATLDAVMRDCGGFAMGPCELMDLIGLDVNLSVSASVFQALGFDRRYAPSLLQQELVRAGRLGRKSGEGFHRYGDGVPRPAADEEAPVEPAGKIAVVGETSPLQPLLDRLSAAGVDIKVSDGASHVEIGAANVALTDGRTATRRAAEEHRRDLVLIDLCADFSKAPRIAVSRADQCREASYAAAVGTLQQAGLAVTPIADIAGMSVMRTVAMLANEAADVVTQGISSAADVDTAMRLGTHYPIGPLAWADRLGPAFVAGVLENLRAHYGEERYRVSPALNRLRWNGGKFHG